MPEEDSDPESLRFGRAYGEKTLASAASREGIAAYAEGRAKA